MGTSSKLLLPPLSLCCLLLSFSISALELPPGIDSRASSLQQRLLSALGDQPPGYEPRTEHKNAAGNPRFINRLIFEQSPYLKQHAHNPVNWFAWSDEAFARAQRENKPVFLSIGYSTCHWCHVMERESFDNERIAEYLNQNFIAIKVDRERRPDIDEIYMSAVQLMTRRGGWPMSSFLTPGGHPFFGGTYFPPDQFLSLLQRVALTWRQRQQELLQSAGEITLAVQQYTAGNRHDGAAEVALLDQAVDQLLNLHDDSHGGFSAAPKFPREPELLLLLDRYQRQPDPRLAEVLHTTLNAMARGGIHDQIGGGFHRYSTDSRWLVPHFEKMLYNQANLARVYLGAYELFGEDYYRQVAENILNYIQREMTSKDGGIYSASDADSGGAEGTFFLWRIEELRQLLGEKQWRLATAYYGMSEKGNFEGANILFVDKDIDSLAGSLAMDRDSIEKELATIRRLLLQQRLTRQAPVVDKKIITAWNAMVISAQVKAYQVLSDPVYLQQAKRTANFLIKNMQQGQELLRISYQGKSSINAKLEDYAYFSEALLNLYDVDRNKQWLTLAEALVDTLLGNFWDQEYHAFFTSADSDLLVARPKNPEDSAIPSGNSVVARVLVRLAQRTGKQQYRQRAQQTVDAFSGLLKRYPAAYAYMLLAAGGAELW